MTEKNLATGISMYGNKLVLEHKGIIWILVSLFSLAACDKYRVYEVNKDLPNKEWYADSTLAFNFDIQDTTLKYNMLYDIRNTLNYPFYNLYITYYLDGPDGKQVSTDLHEMQIMDAKTGEPFGSGLGDIFDNRFYALKNIKFAKKGKYTVRAKQYMRKDPLPEIMAFGIRIEKAQVQ